MKVFTGTRVSANRGVPPSMFFNRGVSRGLPNPPITRLPHMMCYRDYFNLFVAEPIDETEREVGKEITASSLQVLRPPIRSFPHPFQTSTHLHEKGSCCHMTALGIPPYGGFDLGSGGGMKTNPNFGHRRSS